MLVDMVEDHQPLIVYCLLFISVVTLLVYSNTWHVPFTFDDIPAIPHSSFVPHFSFSSSDFLRHALGLRGIPTYTLGVNYYFGGINVVGYHIVNVGIHIINSILVFFLARDLSILVRSTRHYQYGYIAWGNHLTLALCAALVFAVHPVQTMAVTYIVQRLTSLMTLFYLLALVSYVQARKQGWNWTWAGVSLAATVFAMLSKQNSATIPVAIVLLEVGFFSYNYQQFKSHFLRLLPLLLTAFLIPVMLLGLVPFLQVDPLNVNDLRARFAEISISKLTSATSDISRREYFLTQLPVIVHYLRLLLAPFGQNIDHDVQLVKGFTEMRVIGSVLLLATLAVTALLLWKKRQRLISFGILFFFLALSIESSIFPLPDLMFEYRLYLPMVGFSLVAATLFAEAVDRFGRRILWRTVVLGQVIVVLLAVLLMCLAVTTYRRNVLWRDPLALWADAVAKSPRKARPHNNLGILYLEQGRLDEAAELFAKVIVLDAEYSPAYNNLGLIYLQRSQLDRALFYFRKALEFDPRYAHAHNNIGAVYIEQNHVQDAEEAFRTAVELEPRYASARDNLGLIYFKHKRYEEALRQFEQAIAIDPHQAVSYNNLGVVYVTIGRVDEARRAFNTALELDPHHRNATANLMMLDGGGRGGLHIIN